MNQQDNFIWCERYRPTTIADCILPASVKEQFKSFISQGEIPHLMLYGPPGTGKTSAARALCAELGVEVMFINASLESGIDTLRNKITQFASTISLTSAKKVVILDEADYTNPQSFQPALRGFIEDFSNNCRFIFTCNFKNRIIEPLHSRCSGVDFKIDPADKPKLMTQFFKRVCAILKNEGVQFEQQVVAELVAKFFPDYRRTLNELQRYSVGGQIDVGALVNLNDETYNQLVKSLKAKNFTEVRKWVGKNSDIETTELFRKLYDRSVDILEAHSIPQLVLILAEYQYRNAFVADREINIMAALTEIMTQVKFK